MKSRTTPSFWRMYGAFSEEHRNAARRAYKAFLNDSSLPRLHFKKLGGYDDVWSVRINDQYWPSQRSTVAWFWIGTHNEFDKMF